MMPTLVAPIPDTWLSNTGGTVTQVLGSYKILSQGGVQLCAYYEQLIDLSGLVLQEKTLFPISAMIQGNQEIAASTYIPGDSFKDIIVVSTTPMSDDDMINCTAGLMPGMSSNIAGPFLATTDAGMDLQNIVFGQTRTWVYDTTSVPFLRLVSSDNFGTNNGVASRKLYCYRIISLPTNDAAQLQVYPIAIILNGLVDDEDELVRLFRMKRNTRLEQ